MGENPPLIGGFYTTCTAVVGHESAIETLLRDWKWDLLSIEFNDMETAATVGKPRRVMPLVRRHGFWVYTGKTQSGGEVPSAETLIAADREARAESLLAAGSPSHARP